MNPRDYRHEHQLPTSKIPLTISSAWRVVSARLDYSLGICNVISVLLGEGHIAQSQQAQMLLQLQAHRPSGFGSTEGYWWPRTPGGWAVRKAILTLLIDEAKAVETPPISNATHKGRRVALTSLAFKGDMGVITSHGLAEVAQKAWTPPDGTNVLVVLDNGNGIFMRPEHLTLIP